MKAETLHTSTSSTLRALLEGTELPPERKYVPEQELIDGGVYDLRQDDLIDLLTLVRNSDLPKKQRSRLQYQLTILLYQKYVD